MVKKIEYRSTNYAVGYGRVSDISQVLSGHSIVEQEPMLRKFAADKGLIMKKYFADKGKTGTTTAGRDELYAALDYLKEDTSISYFIVQDTDRLARDEQDHFAIRQYLRKLGVKLISINQPGINDSAEGQLLDTIMAGVNAFQSRMNGRKVSKMFDQMVEKGKTTRQAPLGYLNFNEGTEEMPKRTVILNPDTFRLVQEMFELYSGGNYSIADLVRIFNEKGLKSTRGNKLYDSTVANMLRNPYYIGKIYHKGKFYHNGLHPHLISDALFQKCQNVMQEHNQYAIRKRIPENHEKFYLRGFLKCGTCQSRITGSHIKDDNLDLYYCSRKEGSRSYHSNRGQFTAIATVERQVADFFSILELGEGVIEKVLERAKQILAETHGDVDRERLNLTKENTRLENQRQSLEVKLLDGVISDDTYKRQHIRLESDIAQNKLKIEQMSQKREVNVTVFESLVGLARNLSKAYQQSSPEVKMMYLSIFWDFFELKDRQISKAAPSKAVIAMVNEKLIKIRENAPNAGALINKLWLRRLEAVSTCFARGEAGYFPYHVVVEHMNECMGKVG